jgi:hypothetical protein
MGIWERIKDCYRRKRYWHFFNKIHPSPIFSDKQNCSKLPWSILQSRSKELLSCVRLFSQIYKEQAYLSVIGKNLYEIQFFIAKVCLLNSPLIESYSSVTNIMELDETTLVRLFNYYEILLIFTKWPLFFFGIHFFKLGTSLIRCGDKVRNGIYSCVV